MSRAPARRQDAIAELVLADGSAAAADLAERFGVSLMTIHRDLDELERQGIVRKFRGGVTAQPSGVFESNVSFRMRANQEAKDVIAGRAAKLVEPGMAIMLDDSTTALALARRLEGITPLTVVTNFLEIIKLLSGFRDINLLALGGDYDPLHDSFLGVPCVEAIDRLRVDTCFVSTSAVSAGYAFHQEERIVTVKRAMLGSSGRNVLMVDHSKLGRVALHRVAPLGTFDRVIVDRLAGEDSLHELEEHDVTYEVAGR